MLNGFFHGHLQVIEIHRLTHKVKSTPVHGGTDVLHVTVSRYHHHFYQRVAFIYFDQEGEAVHLRHINITQYQRDVGVGVHHFQRLTTVFGKHELVFIFADLLPELLFDQYLQVTFIVYYQDLHFKSLVFSSLKSSGLVRKSLAPRLMAVFRLTSSP
ncbi:hypothetical protein FQZ97_1083840 [compost metagenome]